MSAGTTFSPPPAFGRFRLLHQIGAGVLGPVFRTHDPDDDRLVAVKAFTIDLTPEQAASLADELRRLIALELPTERMAALIEAGVEDTVAYLAQQYVAGESLDAAIRQYGPAPAPDAARLISHVAEALDIGARVGVFHGALHPRDVLVTPGETHLTGLGLATALERVGARAPVRRPYAAPEREAVGPWGAAADIFALAAIAHEVLTGRRALPGTEEPLPGLDEVKVADAAALRDVLEAALDPDPDRRPSAASEFAAAFAGGLGLGPGGAAVSVGRSRRRGRPKASPRLPGLEDPIEPVGPPATVVPEPEPARVPPAVQAPAVEAVDASALAAAKPATGSGTGGTRRRRTAPILAPPVVPEPSPAPVPEPDVPLVAPVVVEPEAVAAVATEVAPEMLCEAWQEAPVETPPPDALREPAVDRPVETAPAALAEPVGEAVPTVEADAPPPADVGVPSAPPTAVDAPGLFDVDEVGPSDRDAAGEPMATEDAADLDAFRLDLDRFRASAAAAPPTPVATPEEEPVVSVPGPPAELVVPSGPRAFDTADLTGTGARGAAGGRRATGIEAGRRTHEPSADDFRDLGTLVAEPPVPRALDPGGRAVSPTRRVEPYRPLPVKARVLTPLVVAGTLAGLIAGLSLGYWWGSRSRPAPVSSQAAVVTEAPSGKAVTSPLGAPAALPVVTPPPPPAKSAEPSAPAVPEKPPSTAAAARPATRTGRLRVRSTPDRADVFVDGVRRGVTPRDVDRLPFGSHTIRVTRPGYEAQERTITVDANSPDVRLRFTLVRAGRSRSGPAAEKPKVPPAQPSAAAPAQQASKATGAIEIETRPPGARVKIDGRDAGVAPTVLGGVAVGRHTIRLELSGYRPWTTTLDVRPGARARIAASLEPVSDERDARR